MPEIKKGMSLFVVEYDYDPVSVRVDEWVVTVIKRLPSFSTPDTEPKQVYLCRKDEFTWVKQSKKHFGYGWAKDINSYYDRKYFKLDDAKNWMHGRGFSFTRKGAIFKAINDCKHEIKYQQRHRESGVVDRNKKCLSVLKRMYTNAKNKKG